MKGPAGPDRSQRSLLQFFKPTNNDDPLDPPLQAAEPPEPRKQDVQTEKTHTDTENETVVEPSETENVPPFEAFRFLPATALQKSVKEEDILPPCPTSLASPASTIDANKAAESNEEIENVAPTLPIVETISPPRSSIKIQNPASPGQPNAYEQERLERIQRNMEVMRSLGLGAGGSASLSIEKTQPPNLPKIRRNGPTTASRKRKSPPQVPAGPLRRSTRQRGGNAIDASNESTLAMKSIQEAELVQQQQQEEEPEVHFDDSSVHHYICETFPNTLNTTTSHGNDWEGSTPSGKVIKGFRKLPGMFIDPLLARAYSVDWRPGLVAAAGKDGYAVVWGSRDLETGYVVQVANNSSHSDIDSEEMEIKPLVSGKLHRGWISDIQLTGINTRTSTSDNNLGNSGGGSGGGEVSTSGVFLLSAGNDGAVCLWDISKTTTAVAGGKEMPRCLARADDLHSGGIFSMHAMGNNVLTGSKDCSVVVSRYDTGGAFSVVRKYEDLHDGVVKCVRWRPHTDSSSSFVDFSSIFASCGNDRRVRILDIREGGSLGSTSGSTSDGIVLDGFHSTTINCVRWSPVSEHLLLSASHDPNLVLHDLRKPDTALYTFTGHSMQSRIKSIYQPVFVAGGAAVATSGDPAHQLSLYSVADGRTISRGGLDITIGATFCGDKPNAPLLCSTNRCIVAFMPRWEEETA